MTKAQYLFYRAERERIAPPEKNQSFCEFLKEHYNLSDEELKDMCEHFPRNWHRRRSKTADKQVS